MSLRYSAGESYLCWEEGDGRRWFALLVGHDLRAFACPCAGLWPALPGDQVGGTTTCVGRGGRDRWFALLVGHDLRAFACPCAGLWPALPGDHMRGSASCRFATRQEKATFVGKRGTDVGGSLCSLDTISAPSLAHAQGFGRRCQATRSEGTTTCVGRGGRDRWFALLVGHDLRAFACPCAGLWPALPGDHMRGSASCRFATRQEKATFVGKRGTDVGGSLCSLDTISAPSLAHAQGFGRRCQATRSEERQPVWEEGDVIGGSLCSLDTISAPSLAHAQGFGRRCQATTCEGAPRVASLLGRRKLPLLGRGGRTSVVRFARWTRSPRLRLPMRRALAGAARRPHARERLVSLRYSAGNSVN